MPCAGWEPGLCTGSTVLVAKMSEKICGGLWGRKRQSPRLIG